MKTIISLGGSLIVQDIINIKFLQKFVSLIKDKVKDNNEFIIIAGGGKTARLYQNAANGANNEDKDWLGINATILNANLLRVLFDESAYKDVVSNPTKKIKTDKIIVASGWKPGCSTDYDAVLFAKTYNAETVINITNVEYLYDKDPRDSGAKKIEKTDWKKLQKIVGNEWKPGLNVPFDPMATKLAAKLKLKLILVGPDLKNFENMLNENNFKGTIVQ